MTPRSPLVSAPVSPRGAVDPVDAHDIVETFFDALGHFGGERPALDDLQRVLAPDAEIIVGTDGSELTSVRYARDAWLALLDAASAQGNDASVGHFFEEIERTITDCAPEVRVGSVVEEMVTAEGAVQRVDTFRCAFVVARVGDRSNIVHLRVQRSVRPAAG